MGEYGLTEAEANTIITQAVDFGMTQLVDGNWGVHGIVPKSVFPSSSRRSLSESAPKMGTTRKPATAPPTTARSGRGTRRS